MQDFRSGVWCGRTTVSHVKRQMSVHFLCRLKQNVRTH